MSVPLLRFLRFEMNATRFQVTQMHQWTSGWLTSGDWEGLYVSGIRLEEAQSPII